MTDLQGSAFFETLQRPMEQLPSKTFCALPWLHLYTDERGHFYPCCINREASARADDENGSPYQMGLPEHPQLAWNAKNRKTMRQQFLRGERPESCSRCFLQEDAGGVSYRMQVNKDYSHEISNLFSGIMDDGSATFNIKFLDLRLGNLCNLRCRMCTPLSSKLILEDYKNVYKSDITKPKWLELRDLDWFKNKEFWDSLPELLPNLELLHFAGGEPFIIQESFDFLSKLVELGFSNKIALSYNSNFTKLPARALELWPHFKSVRLMASLDGFGKLNDYIRYPSRWTDIEKNLRLVDEGLQKYNCSHLMVHTTVQLYNVFQLQPLVDFLAGFKNVNPYPDLSALYGPEQFNIQVLPLHMKKNAEKALLELMPKKIDNIEADYFSRNIKAVIGHMFAKDLTNYLPMFQKATKAYDVIRTENIGDIAPELSELF